MAICPCECDTHKQSDLVNTGCNSLSMAHSNKAKWFCCPIAGTYLSDLPFLPVGCKSPNMAILEANSPIPAVQSPKSHKGKNQRPWPLTQALDIRDAIYRRLKTESLDPSEYAKLARAHKEACELVRDIQGHGRPRPVTARNDPDSHAHKRKSVRSAPIVLPAPPEQEKQA